MARLGPASAAPPVGEAVVVAIPRNPDLEPLVLRGIGSAVGWNVASLRYSAQALLATFFAELSGAELRYVTTRLVEVGIHPTFVAAAVESMRTGLAVRLPAGASASGAPAAGGGFGTVLVVGAVAVFLAVALS